MIHSFLLEEVSAGRELKLSGSIVYEVPEKTKLKDIELENENELVWSHNKSVVINCSNAIFGEVQFCD